MASPRSAPGWPSGSRPASRSDDRRPAMTSHGTEPLAIDGGEPVRRVMLPYARQSIDDTDIAAVSAALRSDWLTTGPRVPAFEQALAAFSGARHAIAFSSGTAALHGAAAAAGLGPGDEAVTTPMTFVATANCVLYVGAEPRFADIDPGTLLIRPDAVEAALTSRTRAILAVDYAGQPADYPASAYDESELKEEVNAEIGWRKAGCRSLKGRPVRAHRLSGGVPSRVDQIHCRSPWA